MINAIAAFKSWDRAKPETFQHVPRSALYDDNGYDFSEDEFHIWRTDYIHQAEERLAYLRSREEMRRGVVSVDGLDVEAKLSGLLRAIRRKIQYPHVASDIEKYFDHEQRRALYGLLDKIEDHILWRGFSSEKAYDLISKARSSRKDKRSYLFAK
jgi:hypothetical protein